MPRAHHHSSTLRQLDAAIAALRAIVSIVASADALARLSAEYACCRRRNWWQRPDGPPSISPRQRDAAPPVP
jgi:hypothetical protein